MIILSRDPGSLIQSAGDSPVVLDLLRVATADVPVSKYAM